MTDSSQPKNLSTDSTDDMFISIGATGSNTFSITSVPSSTMISGSTYDINSIGTITLTGAVGSSYTINDTITLNGNYDFNWGDAKEWVDAFPDWRRVQDMCKKYPGLEIALRNFQTVYTLVKDDYDNPKDES